MILGVYNITGFTRTNLLVLSYIVVHILLLDVSLVQVLIVLWHYFFNYEHRTCIRFRNPWSFPQTPDSKIGVQCHPFMIISSYATDSETEPLWPE